MTKLSLTNLLLALMVATVLAVIASDLVVFRLSHTFVKSGTTLTPPKLPAVAGDLQSFAPILEKGLFGKATQGKLQAIALPTANSGTPGVSQGDLQLLGTAIGSFRETFALIQQISTREERVFRLGEKVFDLGPLVAVKKESVEISVGGQRVTLQTPTSVAAGPAAPPHAIQPGVLAREVTAGSFVIDQRALNAALDNMGQAMTDARLTPSVKEGKVEGFRVTEVRSGGIFNLVGLKNSDVLLRINDFPIDSPEKAIQSLSVLKGQSRIKLDLLRDGRPASLTYDIR
jgi:general secretion pathway protein C